MKDKNYYDHVEREIKKKKFYHLTLRRIRPLNSFRSNSIDLLPNPARSTQIGNYLDSNNREINFLSGRIIRGLFADRFRRRGEHEISYRSRGDVRS